MDPRLRLIDANANRAREATRLLEDVARFLFNNKTIAADAKSLRHGITTAVMSVGDVPLHRDTPGDVGTNLTTEGERRRDDLAKVVAAAGRRLGEALRCLEEVLKTIDGDAASSVEQLRYKGYEIERAVLSLVQRDNTPQWTVCVLLTNDLCGERGWCDTLDSILDGGVDCVQLREKHLGDRALLQRAVDVVQRCHERDVAVMINDRPDIARLSGADGVHLGQDDVSVEAAREIVGPQKVIGVSTSCLEQAVAAREAGADMCGVGPMFPTSTKQKDVIVGPDYLEAFLAWDGLAHLAIGGIDASNVGVLAEHGCRGVAVSSCVCGAADPGLVASEIRDILLSIKVL